MASAIGSKKTVGKYNGPKRFTNGHKQFNSAEAMELSQVLRVEERIASNFELNKLKMTRARNPLAGEQTPRGENSGVPILPDIVPEVRIRERKAITGKIGEHHQKPITEKALSPVKDADRIRTLQSLHDEVAGELNYWKSKIAERELRMQTSILRNRLKGQI